MASRARCGSHGGRVLPAFQWRGVGPRRAPAPGVTVRPPEAPRPRSLTWWGRRWRAFPVEPAGPRRRPSLAVSVGEGPPPAAGPTGNRGRPAAPRGAGYSSVPVLLVPQDQRVATAGPGHPLRVASWAASRRASGCGAYRSPRRIAATGGGPPAPAHSYRLRCRRGGHRPSPRSSRRRLGPRAGGSAAGAGGPRTHRATQDKRGYARGAPASAGAGVLDDAQALERPGRRVAERCGAAGMGTGLLGAVGARSCLTSAVRAAWAERREREAVGCGARAPGA